jgi:hypothetical protein
MALTAKQVAEKLVTKLEAPANNGRDKDDLKKEIKDLLDVNGFKTPAERNAVETELKGLLADRRVAARRAAATARTTVTGTCYYDEGGILKCDAGVTETACAGHSGSQFIPDEKKCMLVVANALREETINLVA